MENENKSLDSWDDYIGSGFLKAEMVNSESEAFAIIAVNESTDFEGNKAVRLQLERSEKKYDFDLNKTNAKALKELGAENPKSLIGKRISFKKVLVMNPTSKKEVDSLRISSLV